MAQEVDIITKAMISWYLHDIDLCKTGVEVVSLQLFQVVRCDAAEAMEAEVGPHPALVRQGVSTEDQDHPSHPPRPLVV